MDTPRGTAGRVVDPVGVVLNANFTYFPYHHQLIEFERHCETTSRALLWQMRTGKTKACIDVACHNAVSHKLDAVIVLAPNGVHENWIRRELPKHHWPSVDRDTLYWSTDVAGKLVDRAKVRKGLEAQHEAFWRRATRLLKTDDRLTWFAFASETVTRTDVRKLIARIVSRKKRILLIIDECDDYGKAGSKKTKMVRALSKKCFMKRILSGTPVENSPLRAFAQYEMLQAGILGFTRYADFKSRYAEYEIKTTRQGRNYPMLKEYRNLDELTERMAEFSSVVLRGDCEDLPDLIPVPRRIELTPQQQDLYRQLHSTYELKMQSGETISVGENTARLIKFQQIVSGYIKDEFGEYHEIPGGNPRLDALLDEVMLSSGKTIIWCIFRPDLDRVSAALRAKGRKVLEYHGRTSSADKALARIAFAPESDSDYTDLVGHPKSGGRGLDLSGASKIIHYSHTFDAIVRSQSDERATQMGGENIPIVDLIAPGVDEYALEVVKKKMNVADSVAREGMKEVLRRIDI